ncbi:MAG TPA: DNA-processing protein DprA [Solirubrobacterales bacterium]
MTGGDHPRACPDCLRRAWLVGSLAGHIEKAVDKTTPGSRVHEILALSDAGLARAMARSQADSFLERASSRDPERILAAVAGARAWACCRHDRFYPAALADLGDAPAVLFGRGDHALLAKLAPEETVTIVGSRRPSGYGRELATEVGRDVASSGLAVVSGLAMGIDSCAHIGALEAGGLTVAVLGTGVDVPYPPRSTRLYEEIVDRGLVIGELPPGTTARRWTFPARNRIMAALGRMTVVVEARERSGSLITAEMAQDLNREVGAVPGRVGSSPAAGTNGLLRDGACVIRGADDVLDSMLGIGAGARRAGFQPRGPALEADLAAVLDLVDRGASTADALARASGLEPGPLAAALVRLELSGYVRSEGGGRYERTALATPEAA